MMHFVLGATAIFFFSLYLKEGSERAIVVAIVMLLVDINLSIRELKSK